MTLSIKHIEYNSDLDGFILTLSNNKIVQVQFAIETNRLHADYNQYYAEIDKQNDYNLNLTDEESDIVEKLIRNNAEINEKLNELNDNKL